VLSIGSDGGFLTIGTSRRSRSSRSGPRNEVDQPTRKR
jgi:hypothetical protein